MSPLLHCLLEVLRVSMLHPHWRIQFVSLSAGGSEQVAHFYVDEIELEPGDALTPHCVERQSGPLRVRLFGPVRIHEVARAV